MTKEQEQRFTEEMARQGLTVKWTFVPLSTVPLEDRGAQRFSLHWRVTLCKDGVAVLTTAYTEGQSSCPSCPPFRPIPLARTGEHDAGLPLTPQEATQLALECEHGVCARTGASIAPNAVAVVETLAAGTSVLSFERFEAWAAHCDLDLNSRREQQRFADLVAVARALRAHLGEEGLAALRKAAFVGERQPHIPVIPPPPTEEELPCDDGTPMESGKHRWQMDLICGTLEDLWKDRSDVYVAGNMALYYSVRQAQRQDFRAPDVMIFVGTTAKPDKSWVVWEQEGRTPDVIIELTSEETAAIDRGEKMQVYRVLKIPEYFIFDPVTGILEGYRLDSGQMSYQPLGPNAAGRLVSLRLGLELGVWDGTFRSISGSWLRWYTPLGALVPTPREERQQAEEALRLIRQGREKARPVS